MKIEKISDNQIRCRLTREDLAERQIRISELAYGSEKARALFRDMMTQAYREYGFANDANTPLMIEAIPDMENSLTIVITKVDDPEELDTRFAKFSPTAEKADRNRDETKIEGADDILDVFKRLYESAQSGSDRGTRGRKQDAKDAGGAGASPAADTGSAKTAGRTDRKQPAKKEPVPDLIRVCRFSSLDDAISAARALGGQFTGKSSLYRTGKSGKYLLVVHQGKMSPEQFNKVCNILSEYGSGESFSASKEAHLIEHGMTVVSGSALQKLLTLA